MNAKMYCPKVIRFLGIISCAGILSFAILLMILNGMLARNSRYIHTFCEIKDSKLTQNYAGNVLCDKFSSSCYIKTELGYGTINRWLNIGKANYTNGMKFLDRNYNKGNLCPCYVAVKYRLIELMLEDTESVRIAVIFMGLIGFVLFGFIVFYVALQCKRREGYIQIDESVETSELRQKMQEGYNGSD